MSIHGRADDGRSTTHIREVTARRARLVPHVHRSNPGAGLEERPLKHRLARAAVRRQEGPLRCLGLIVDQREAWRGKPSDLTVGERGGTLCSEIDATE